MYKWQQEAKPCEVCASIGKTALAQSQIRKLGLCYTCGPTRRLQDPRLISVGYPVGWKGGGQIKQRVNADTLPPKSGSSPNYENDPYQQAVSDLNQSKKG